MAKAQAAEQKALAARDDTARDLAWRDAARQWDRAADRETDDKRKQEYSARAETARTTADNLNEPDEAKVARPRMLDKTSN